MHLYPGCSARQTPSRICRHHGYIGTAGKTKPVIVKLRPLLQRRGLGGGGMHLNPERSARQTPSRICRHHGYIDPAGKIAAVIMKLRPLLQIQWPAPPPPRRSNGPAVRRAAQAPPRSSPPMRRAAPTANFPAAGGRRPAGETRCVALDRFSLLSGTGPLVVIFSLIK